MRLQINDSVTLTRRPGVVGIVQGFAGDKVTVWVPTDVEARKKYPRGDVRPLAELIAELRSRGTNGWARVLFNGESTFADLVAAFGYSTGRLRQDSLDKVVRQLQRAGLDVVPLTGGWGRDDRFRLKAGSGTEPEPPPRKDAAAPGPTVPVELPETFWPTSFGLPPQREAAFLHALMGSRPILCILEAPNAESVASLPAAWEGLIGRAFRSAQAFARRGTSDFDLPEVQVGPASLLHTFLKLVRLTATALYFRAGGRVCQSTTSPARSRFNLPPGSRFLDQVA